ncbi:tyrosine-type recombinase/integrase [Rhizobium sp. SGZ-381]|uniref:tyrosine-type recombinase/integrase n=1 Tax=Rhizobium sp. SGZ-381 TaxID=3342800 RepID=UPI003671B304
MFEWAIKSDLTEFDPTHGVERLTYKTDGFEPWTSEDVHLFCRTWQIGTAQRLAMELLLCSGLRRSDIVRAGRQHMTGNVFSMRTRKTGADVTVEFPDRLMKVIEETKTGEPCLCRRRERPALHSRVFWKLVSQALHRCGRQQECAWTAETIRHACCKRRRFVSRINGAVWMGDVSTSRGLHEKGRPKEARNSRFKIGCRTDRDRAFPAPKF